jgi:Sel1 repeat
MQAWTPITVETTQQPCVSGDHWPSRETQFQLGLLYAKGQGVPQDYVQARKWWKEAATQGLAEAQLAVAQMYERGEGVKQNYTKAASWYRWAAEQKVAEAQFRLGQYYTSGLGVEKDEEKSTLWYRLAARQGHEEAVQAVGQELTNDEVAQLEEFSRSLKPISSAQLDEMLREEEVSAGIPWGWISWFLLLNFTIVWSYGWYRNMKQPGGSLTFGTMNTVIIWWLLLAWTFHYSNMNKLHLLWLAPLVLPTATLMSIKTVLDSLGQGKYRQLPAGMWKLLVIYVGVLSFLTF